MLATVGHAAPCAHGRQELKWLANLEVPTKAVERTAQARADAIAAREQ